MIKIQDFLVYLDDDQVKQALDVKHTFFNVGMISSPVFQYLHHNTQHGLSLSVGDGEGQISQTVLGEEKEWLGCIKDQINADQLLVFSRLEPFLLKLSQFSTTFCKYGWVKDAQRCLSEPLLFQLGTLNCSYQNDADRMKMFRLVKALNACFGDICSTPMPQQLKDPQQFSCNYVKSSLLWWCQEDAVLCQFLRTDDISQKSRTLSANSKKLLWLIEDALNNGNEQDVSEAVQKFIQKGLTKSVNTPKGVISRVFQALPYVLVGLLALQGGGPIVQAHEIVTANAEWPPEKREYTYGDFKHVQPTKEVTFTNTGGILFDKTRNTYFLPDLGYDHFDDQDVSAPSPYQHGHPVDLSLPIVPSKALFVTNLKLPSTIHIYENETDMGNPKTRLCYQIVQKLFFTLPPFLKTILESRGLHIEMVDYYPSAPTRGGTSNRLMPYISLRQFTDNRNFLHATIHEIAHTFLHLFVNVEYDDEFENNMLRLYCKFSGQCSLSAVPKELWSLMSTPSREFLQFLMPEVINNPTDISTMYFTLTTLRTFVELLYEEMNNTTSYKNTYAQTSVDEYWAECVSNYLGVSANTDMTGHPINAVWYAKNDPKMYNLLRLLFGPAEQYAAAFHHFLLTD